MSAGSPLRPAPARWVPLWWQEPPMRSTPRRRTGKGRGPPTSVSVNMSCLPSRFHDPSAMRADPPQYTPRSGQATGCSALRRPALPRAVDPQHLTRNEGAERTGEYLDHPGDLIDGGDTVERAGLDHPVLIHRARAHEAAGAGVTGRDAVHRDVVG